MNVKRHILDKHIIIKYNRRLNVQQKTVLKKHSKITSLTMIIINYDSIHAYHHVKHDNSLTLNNHNGHAVTLWNIN